MHTKQIYLTPFTAESIMLLHMLEERGTRVEAIIDNNPSLHGKNYKHVNIVSVQVLAEKKDSVVILCRYPLYGEMSKQIAQFPNAEIEYIEHFIHNASIESGIEAIDKESFLQLAPQQRARLDRLPSEMLLYKVPQDTLMNEALILDGLSISTTSKCSLKCRHCADLMQYYSSPQNYDLQEIFDSFELLMKHVDFTRVISIVGGELFVYQQILPELFEKLYSYSGSYGQLRIVTNGTIIPGEHVLKALKKFQVFVEVSDYGKIAANQQELLDTLRQWQIPHVLKVTEWYAYRQLCQDGKQDGQQLFSTCMGKIICAHLHAKKLYYCPFLLHAENLRAIPFGSSNSLDLSDSNLSKKMIKQHLTNVKAPAGCSYCSGYSLRNAQKVPIAQQISAPIPYKVFNPR